MRSRREFMLGGMLLAASGTAYALTPRRKLSLLNGADLGKMIPRSFGGWSEVPTDALVVPQTEGSLSARLYSQTVGRVYQNSENEIVMMLIAYGDTQSDQLQLHRPETCYPAFGFDIEAARPVPIPLAPGVAIPARRLTALTDVRREQIMYWTRIGEHLPASEAEQRLMKLRTAFAGWIPDGVLVRFSNVSRDPEVGDRVNARFAAAFVDQIPPAARRVLMGTALSQRLAG
ncbi:MAG TPA: EpsI family protein [Allosphingosinicella sp.]|jgi:EpsI family protein